MNFKKYKRFFAFGCSFTDYYWPTWANIISKEIPDSYIYAKNGAGNFYIYQALMEAIIHHKIDKDDLVMIMFSNVTREDRFTRSRGWITTGNLYHQNEYDQTFLDKYLCDHGYLMRDLNLVQGCRLSLDSIGCDYELMSMVPFDSKRSDSYNMTEVDYLLKFYEGTINKVHPSVLDTVFRGDWNSRKKRPKYKCHWSTELYVDNHPTPAEHLEYLKLTFTDMQLSQSTLSFVDKYTARVMHTNYSIYDTPDFDKKIQPRLGESSQYE